MRIGRVLLLGVAAFSLTIAPAMAQDNEDTGTNWPLPRNQTPGQPGSPGKAECGRKPCIYLVNVSNHRVIEFHYATGRDAKGIPTWSRNQFDPQFNFYSKRWTAWFVPKGIGCELDLKIVMSVDGQPVEESGLFDICANPTLLFTIRDPKEPVGTVIFDPGKDGTGTPAPTPAPKP